MYAECLQTHLGSPFRVYGMYFPPQMTPDLYMSTESGFLDIKW